MKVIAITPHKKWDTLASLIIEGLQDLSIDIIATDYGNGIQKTYSDEEIIDHAKDADYIFAFWGKHGINGVPSPKYYLLDKINRPEITAYIDGSEWTYTGYPNHNQHHNSTIDENKIKGEPWINEELYNQCSWYFKRLVLPEDLERPKIFPCYIGAQNSYFKSEGQSNNIKKNDIYCSFGGGAGHISTGLRAPVYNYLYNTFVNNQQFAHINTVIGQKLETSLYFNMIKQSYINISAWGAGNCCRRMWEIISNKSCCFIQKPFIIYPDKLIDGESCVYYSTLEEFIEKLEYYLNNKDKCIQIGENGYKHIKKYHTGKQRVKYMLNIMKGIN